LVASTVMASSDIEFCAFATDNNPFAVHAQDDTLNKKSARALRLHTGMKSPHRDLLLLFSGLAEPRHAAVGWLAWLDTGPVRVGAPVLRL
jgi:hypothetical protein